MSDSLRTQDQRSIVHDCLSHALRRYVLHQLRKRSAPMELADLAEDVAEWQGENPEAEVADQAVKDAYLQLYHKHVPKLAAADLVHYDQEQDVVEASDRVLEWESSAGALPLDTRLVDSSEETVGAADDDPPSADEDVARLRLQLSHLSLRELEDRGIVEWNREAHVVRKGPKFENKRTELATGQR